MKLNFLSCGMNLSMFPCQCTSNMKHVYPYYLSGSIISSAYLSSVELYKDATGCKMLASYCLYLSCLPHTANSCFDHECSSCRLTVSLRKGQ